jgi:hypothetical protein
MDREQDNFFKGVKKGFSKVGHKLESAAIGLGQGVTPWAIRPSERERSSRIRCGTFCWWLRVVNESACFS